MLATINAKLADKGLLLKSGKIVDATLISEPRLSKNTSGQRDLEDNAIAPTIMIAKKSAVMLGANQAC